MFREEKTLTDVIPDSVERLTLEVSDLNAKVHEINEELKAAIGANALEVQNLTGRIEAAHEIIQDIQGRYDAAINAMADVRQLQALKDIAKSLEGIHQIKKKYADKMNGKEAAREKVKRDNAGHMAQPKPKPSVTVRSTQDLGSSPPTNASIKDALEGRGVNTDLVAISLNGELAIITPIKFLGDLWPPINSAIRDMGGKWIRDGRQSRWEIKGATA